MILLLMNNQLTIPLPRPGSFLYSRLNDIAREEINVYQTSFLYIFTSKVMKTVIITEKKRNSKETSLNLVYK